MSNWHRCQNVTWCKKTWPKQATIRRAWWYSKVVFAQPRLKLMPGSRISISDDTATVIVCGHSSAPMTVPCCTAGTCAYPGKSGYSLGYTHGLEGNVS